MLLKGNIVRRTIYLLPLFLIELTVPLRLHAVSDPSLTATVRERIDRIAQQVLQQTGVPSASLAVVAEGQIAYVHAYGKAHLDPERVARPEMRYSIGSISKQFTATAVLMLAEQGKLSLDDPVAKYLPNLTRAKEVTIRQLLSHTSGYQDYWPQDYVPPLMTQPVTADAILDRWARKPLDFDPGTKWQYSNTNYVIAGVIVEKVSGEPLPEFLQKHVFSPLGMQRVDNVDLHALPATDATGYMRYALGPPRVAPKEGPGWLFAAGELAMPAEELAKWDAGVISQRLLKPASYQEMENEVKLKGGAGTGYALGVSVGAMSGHRVVRHGGEVSGFVAQNLVFPDDKLAVVVLTNQDASSAAASIARQVAIMMLAPSKAAAPGKLELAKRSLSACSRARSTVRCSRKTRTLILPNRHFRISLPALARWASPWSSRRRASRDAAEWFSAHITSIFPNEPW